MIAAVASADTRIAHGARCTWWDGIENVGTITATNGASLPCCPHCRHVLFEVPSPEVWWKNVDAHQANGHDGYHAFIEWMKGKCFPSMQEALRAYQAKPGRTVTL